MYLGGYLKRVKQEGRRRYSIANMSGSETLGHDLLVGDTMNPMIKVEG